ncbi:MAG: hypothetical protein KKE77_08885 [Alphaproteobacteria bacterium]|nr:hypothetical protein [Alphaproteobacteria bacterium]MBU1756713.1 hypothetical protein [Alphaproteobacteria bacterium]MBU2033440.1 hypothetical protein [Alphaproteobacteria bacterium]MBU2341338.1 hypothetical protein [Alphaproteobacteria bacterium]
MATQPDPSPDTIDPGAPSELPIDNPPLEEPMREPDEIEPVQPDTDNPGANPDEI